MKKILSFLLIVILLTVSACTQKPKVKFGSLVLVKGGIFKNSKTNYYEKGTKISNFYIGKYEVTQREWREVMGSNPSKFKGDSLPVETVSWYDCVEYCNKESVKDNLKPYYNIDKDKKDPNNKDNNDNVKWTVTTNKKANGYRLPTEAEWEYAASGGQLSKNYIYSGSNNADQVSWYWKNSGDKYLLGQWNWPTIENNRDKTKAIGSKKPNELGLYDMSGNVREWCWNWYTGTDINGRYLRVCKGGGWLGDVSCCQLSFTGKFDANGKGCDVGLRVCRNQ